MGGFICGFVLSFVPHLFFCRYLVKAVLRDCNISWISSHANDKASVTSVTSKDSSQPVHLPSMTMFLVYPSLDSPEAVDGICDQQKTLISLRMRAG